jgi:hypothetical protein
MSYTSNIFQTKNLMDRVLCLRGGDPMGSAGGVIVAQVTVLEGTTWTNLFAWRLSFFVADVVITGVGDNEEAFWKCDGWPLGQKSSVVGAETGFFFSLRARIELMKCILLVCVALYLAHREYKDVLTSFLFGSN